jgi:hypothetical protein
MVLERVDHPDFVECFYGSTNVLASKYVKSKKDLMVIFGSGRQYIYSGVMEEDYNKFQNSQSQGVAIKEYIYKYPNKLGAVLQGGDLSLIKGKIQYLLRTR